MKEQKLSNELSLKATPDLLLAAKVAHDNLIRALCGNEPPTMKIYAEMDLKADRGKLRLSLADRVGMKVTPAKYKRERQKHGTQEKVAALLEVQRVTIARRETKGPISREAWLALCSLPIVDWRS